MPEFQDELIFRVDFNNVHGDLIKGSLLHASQARIPREDERALLRDWEGNQCYAWVEELRGQIVYFELDLITWTSVEDVQADGISLATPRAFALTS